MKVQSVRIRKRILAALELVDRRLQGWLENFSPVNEQRVQIQNYRFKAIAELCLYVHLARVFDRNDEVECQIEAPLRNVILAPAFLRLILNRPYNTTSSITCILPFRKEETCRRIARYYKDICQPFRNEMLPFDVLSHVYNFDILELYDSETKEIERRAIDLSSLVLTPNALFTLSLGAYPLTHTAFYASRFGEKRLDLGDYSDTITLNIDIELCKAYSTHNLDVALELVLTRMFLFGTLSIYDCVIIVSAISLIEKTGFVVSPPHSGVEFFENGSSDRTWAEQYHSMIVLGILLRKLAVSNDIVDTHAAHLENELPSASAALEMDAVGAIYRSVGKGNLPLAVILYSKLGDLPECERPPKRLLEGFRELMLRLNEVFSVGMADNSERIRAPADAWSLSNEEFTRTLEAFAQLEGRGTSSNQAQSLD